MVARPIGSRAGAIEPPRRSRGEVVSQVEELDLSGTEILDLESREGEILTV